MTTPSRTPLVFNTDASGSVDYGQGPPIAAPVVKLSLLDEAAVVREEAARRGVAHSAVALAKHDDVRVMLLTLDAGAIIQRHRVDATATLLPVEGRIRVHLPEETIELAPGQLLVLERNVPHDLEAAEQSAVLLTTGYASVADREAYARVP